MLFYNIHNIWKNSHGLVLRKVSHLSSLSHFFIKYTSSTYVLS